MEQRKWTRIMQTTVDAISATDVYEKMENAGDPTLASGHSGVLLALLEWRRIAPSEVPMERLHVCSSSLVRALERETPLGAGGIVGLGGVAYAVKSLHDETGYYSRLLGQLHDLWLARVDAHLAMWDRTAEFVAARTFDVISGAAGLARILLEFVDYPECAQRLNSVLKRLVDLCTFVQVGSCQRARWHTPADLFPLAFRREQYPFGWVDCGMAHGVAGPLAVLSLSHEAGIVVPGQLEAISRIAHWLEEWIQEEPEPARWSTILRVTAEGETVCDSYKARPAWCYGFAGTAVALHHAAVALGRSELKVELERWARALLAAEPQELGFVSPTLCHGYASFALAMSVLLPRDCIELHRCWDVLVQSFADPGRRFVFANVERGEADLEVSDVPGLLSGAAGVACALAAARSLLGGDEHTAGSDSLIPGTGRASRRSGDWNSVSVSRVALVPRARKLLSDALVAPPFLLD